MASPAGQVRGFVFSRSISFLKSMNGKDILQQFVSINTLQRKGVRASNRLMLPALGVARQEQYGEAIYAESTHSMCAQEGFKREVSEGKLC